MNSKILLHVAGILAMMLMLDAWAYAHHGFRAFDRTKAVSLTGVVRSVEWVNPHVIVYLDVKSDGGKVETWAIQTAPPNILVRGGMPRDALKAGVVFTVTGYAPRTDLTDYVFAPASAATFVQGGHMLYSYEVKIVGHEQPRSAGVSTAPSK